MPDYRIGRLRGGFCIVWYDAAGKRHRHALDSKDARGAEVEAPGVYVILTRPRGTNVEALWQAYCKDRAGRAVTGTMVHTWKALSPRFGAMRADAITIADCRAHTNARRQVGIRDGTIHTELGHLRMVLRWAEHHRLIDKAPHIERPPKPKPKDRHLTREQVRALVDACTMPHLTLFVHLAYGTAGRAGAILDLTWDRCDLERGKIDLENPDIALPHKGRAIVPMTRTIRAALLTAKPGAVSPYVVEWAGEKVGSVKKGLAAAGRKIGAKVTPHMLRHSAAVHMAEDGVPLEEVASYLGHSNVTITRRIYARFSPDHLRGAARALELDDLAEAKRRTA